MENSVPTSFERVQTCQSIVNNDTLYSEVQLLGLLDFNMTFVIGFTRLLVDVRFLTSATQCHILFEDWMFSSEQKRTDPFSTVLIHILLNNIYQLNHFLVLQK